MAALNKNPEMMGAIPPATQGAPVAAPAPKPAAPPAQGGPTVTLPPPSAQGGAGAPTGGVMQTTGAPAPAPSGAPAQVTTPPPPTSTYSGVPVVITGTNGTTTAQMNDAINAALGIATGPIDTSKLDASLAATGANQQQDAATAAAYAASAAFGQGAAGTPVQAVASNAVQDVMRNYAQTEAQTSLDFYNQQSANQINAINSALQGTSNAGNLQLSTQTAQQNALLGSEAADLAREGQAYNQSYQSTQQATDALNQLVQAGQIPQANEQAQLDANYGTYTYNQQQMNDIINQVMALLQATPVASGPGSGTSVGGSADVGQIISAFL